MQILTNKTENLEIFVSFIEHPIKVPILISSGYEHVQLFDG